MSDSVRLLPRPEWPSQVRILEVGPRDGLQNEPEFLPTVEKIRFLSLLAEAGFPEIEATSFVHPRRVPQLADADAVLRALPVSDHVRWTALVPNERGLDRALAAGARRIALFVAATDAFSTHNLGMDVAASLASYRKVARRALDEGLTLRGYVSTAFECPYSGPVEPEAVAPVAAALLEMGVSEVSLGDTLGVAVPTEVWRLLDCVADRIPLPQIALHFHDTSGTALANVIAGLDRGVAAFDTAAGGLGGCPFAPGAAGNLASEDLVYALHRLGIHTGVDLLRLVAATEFLEGCLGRPLPGRCYHRLRTQPTACRSISIRQEGNGVPEGEP